VSEQSPLRSKSGSSKRAAGFFRLRSLAPPFQLRPAALGSQFIGFVLRSLRLLGSMIEP